MVRGTTVPPYFRHGSPLVLLATVLCLSAPTLDVFVSRTDNHQLLRRRRSRVHFELGLSVTETDKISDSQFTISWTVDTGSTTEQDTPIISNVTISLHGELKGNLMSNVQNNIWKHESVTHLTSYKGTV